MDEFMNKIPKSDEELTTMILKTLILKIANTECIQNKYHTIVNPVIVDGMFKEGTERKLCNLMKKHGVKEGAKKWVGDELAKIRENN